MALPAAGLCILGPLEADTAWDEIDALAPTLGFWPPSSFSADSARSRVFPVGRGPARPRRGGRSEVAARLGAGVGTAITNVLSLDATVVLFTPVVIAAAVRVGVPARPHLHATAHLANSASLLLPVSNLTNLLAYEGTGLSFARFAALMVLPLLVLLVVEYVGTRLCFAGDLAQRGTPAEPAPGEPVPVFALGVLGATLAGLVANSPLDIAPGWVAALDLLRWGEPGFPATSSTVWSTSRTRWPG